MYFKLAYQNVKKSFRDFLIYFLTLAFSVCLFYTFNSFQEQTAVLSLNDFQFAMIEATSIIMNLLSVLVMIVFAFLILYANRVLIKRRKQEFGLYLLLGMPKSKINRILVYETALIGVISMIAGMVFGILLSQCLSILTASLFEVTLNYHFIFSWDSAVFTILSFLGIFLITLLFNGFEINRFKLIDLLHASQKHQKGRLNNLLLSVVVFIVSLVLIGYAYYLAGKGVYAITGDNIKLMFICGLAGTFLFFFSLSGFLLRFIQTSKRLYYRNLNLFVLKQLNANINSNFFSMSIISILLLLSIGALSTGFSLRNSINATIRLVTPYEASATLYNGDISKMEYDEELLGKPHLLTVYAGGNLNELAKYADDEKIESVLVNSAVSTLPMEIVKLSEFNQMLQDIGEDPISIKQGEALAFSSSDIILDYLLPTVKNQPVIDIFGKTIQVKEATTHLYSGCTTNSMSTFGFTFVVNDDVIPKDAPITRSSLNFNPDGEYSSKWGDSLSASATDYMENAPLIETEDGFHSEWGFDYSFRKEVMENSIGLSTIFTYIGLYLGTVFLIACSVMLALQQLSNANQDQMRYRTLSQLGCDKRMMNHSILLQISLYFIIPLIVGIIHSIVGIHLVSGLVEVFGRIDILESSLYTGMILLVVYGSYFYITYLGYRSIIHSKS